MICRPCLITYPSRMAEDSLTWTETISFCVLFAGSTPDEVTEFFNLPDPSRRTMALGPTQPLTERVPGIFLGSKGRPARKGDSLIATRELIT
jgi:hypothetical protein